MVRRGSGPGPSALAGGLIGAVCGGTIGGLIGAASGGSELCDVQHAATLREKRRKVLELF